MVPAIVTVVLALAFTPSPASAQVQPNGEWAALRGSASGIQQPRRIVVQDEKTWKALWAEHARGTDEENKPPRVDFSREMVVAVFAGVQNEMVPVELDVKQDEATSQAVAAYRVKREGYHLMVLCQPWAMRKVSRAPQVQFQEVAPPQKQGDTPGGTPKVGTGKVSYSPETGIHDAAAKIAVRIEQFAGGTQVPF
ncbi:MAG: hypothetical protein NTX64_10960 [Elusimicrobia bacterium]|nr:hypothetical protein [Elusimicrobiota bacterium]